MISIQKGGLASGTLDFVRFFAALAVLLGHGVSRFFGPYNPLDNPSILEKTFRVLMSGYGSHGVTIFFILSGLFIGYSVINQVQRKSFSWKSYLGRRLIRLWIVLIPALVLTDILDYFGLLYFYSDAIYSNGDVIGAIDGNNNLIIDFFGNMFFLQTILVPTFGTNGALWSLANEFWYYVLFPLAIFIFINKGNIQRSVCFAMLFVSVCFFIGAEITLSFSIWLLGVGIIVIPTNNVFRIKNAVLYSLVGLLISLVALRIAPEFDDKFIERALVSIPFLLFVITVIANDKVLAVGSRYLSISNKMAGFSYTLYLVHTPILCLVRGLVIGDSKYWAFNVINIFFFLLITGFILVIAYLIASVTEAHTSKLYRVLKI
jgi:peptidoglycan/LPS O-acetylase OafA/YrhL